MIGQLFLALLGPRWQLAKLVVIGVCWSLWLGWRIAGGIERRRKRRRGR